MNNEREGAIGGTGILTVALIGRSVPWPSAQLHNRHTRALLMRHHLTGMGLLTPLAQDQRVAGVGTRCGHGVRGILKRSSVRKDDSVPRSPPS
jgi:hypothetical protein